VAELKQRIAWEEQAARLVELREGWGELVNPRQPEFDTPGFGCSPASARPSRVEDRRHGRNAPHFETEQDLARIRGLARWLAATDETTIGVLENLTNYVIGPGFKYTATAASDAPAGLAEAVQRVIDEFFDRNDWSGDLEREIFARSRRDGETFLRLHATHEGQVDARLIEPEFVAEPTNRRDLEDWLGHESPLDWSFGVCTEAGDVQTVHGYHVAWPGSPADWEYVPAGEMEHVKVNVDRNLKRGLSDFHPVAAEIEGAAKLLRNTREGAAIQAAIAFIREHAPGATASGIEALQAAKADYTVSRPSPQGARTAYVRRFDPGTILDVPRGMNYHAAPLGSAQGPNFIGIQQAVLRAIGTRWCMPEYMISGDASNANYSSTLVAEAPFVRHAQAEQRFYKSRFSRVMWKVLRVAGEAGRFDRHGVDFASLKHLVRVQIEPPDVVPRNRVRETELRKMLHEAGLLSKRTWASQEGLDWHQEQENCAAECDGVPN